MGVIIMMMARNCTPSACSGVQLSHIENIERVQLPCIEMRLDRAFDGEELYSEPRFGSATPSHRRGVQLPHIEQRTSGRGAQAGGLWVSPRGFRFCWSW